MAEHSVRPDEPEWGSGGMWVLYTLNWNIFIRGEEIIIGYKRTRSTLGG